MHGGDVYRNEVHMDFSVNVNPLGVPNSVREALWKGMEQITAYPDPQCETLREKLALHFGMAPGNVLCGNGASELLMGICRWRKPGKALLLAPGFSGYQRALRAAGCEVEWFFLEEQEGFGLPKDRLMLLRKRIMECRPDVILLANPSNPVGYLVQRNDLLELVRLCEDVGTTLVVDECFMELTGDPKGFSLAAHLKECPRLLLLRAFTKSFAIPGIRLGYLLSENGNALEQIGRELPEWNVSVPAQLAGVAALEEMGHLQRSREVIAAERAFLSSELRELGAKVYPSEADFILFWWKDAGLYQKLLKRSILIRDCRDYAGLKEGYFRVAVKRHGENEALIRAIREVRAGEDKT